MQATHLPTHPIPKPTTVRSIPRPRLRSLGATMPPRISRAPAIHSPSGRAPHPLAPSPQARATSTGTRTEPAARRAGGPGSRAAASPARILWALVPRRLSKRGPRLLASSSRVRATSVGSARSMPTARRARPGSPDATTPGGVPGVLAPIPTVTLAEPDVADTGRRETPTFEQGTPARPRGGGRGLAAVSGIRGRLSPMRVAGLAVARTYAAMPVSRARGEAGMSTAEYAVGTVAACGFAALLFKILTSSKVRGLVVNLVTRALNLAG